MKCGIKTIRGVLDISANSHNADNLIFSYEGTDMTRGWKVIEAYCWFPKLGLHVGTADSAAVCRMKLQTDYNRGTLPIYEGWNEMWMNPADNREFGWVTRTYDPQGEGDKAFRPVFAAAIIDPEHLITRDLYLSFPCQFQGADEGDTWHVAWLIVMEEQTITPSEQILQSVKGVAQNISS